jgi:4-amino-4-deoxychorismate lyase
LKQWPHTQEAHLSRALLEQAGAIFICNAVRGILAVHRLGESELLIDQDMMNLQQQLAVAEPAFAGAVK